MTGGTVKVRCPTCRQFRDINARRRGGGYPKGADGIRERRCWFCYVSALRSQTHCPNGHWLTDENRDKHGKCRICVAAKVAQQLAPAGNWTKERLDPAPILRWLDAYLLTHPDESLERLCLGAGVASRRIGDWRVGKHTASLRVVDGLLVAAGEPPHTLHALYPIEGGADIPLVLPEPPHKRRPQAQTA